MNNLRKRILLGFIPNEEESEILDPLMERFFRSMTTEERLVYMKNLIPKYIEMAFQGVKGQEKVDASNQLLADLMAQVKEVNKIEVKWLETPADQRAEINCC